MFPRDHFDESAYIGVRACGTCKIEATIAISPRLSVARVAIQEGESGLDDLRVGPVLLQGVLFVVRALRAQTSRLAPVGKSFAPVLSRASSLAGFF